MHKKFSLSLILTAVFILSACVKSPTQAPAASPTIEHPTLPPVVTSTQVQLPTVASPTQAAATPTLQPAGPLPDISRDSYIDDRSTPAALMLSYFNAINRQEYLRAYSYVSEAPNAGTFDQFQKGYSDTQSVSVAFGGIGSGGAAGSIYYTVPMVLNSTLTNGTAQKFAACYLIRHPQPGNYGAPPISPMHVENQIGKLVPVATSDADTLAAACPLPDFEVGPFPQAAKVESLDDISDNNFIDNRSDPVTVIKSYLNAINKMEYVRAYSYFQETTTAYSEFEAQNSNIRSVSAQFGTVTPDAGAGQTYFTVPAVVNTAYADGSKKTFAVCYTLHLSQPAIQATPPFQPLGIKTITSKPAAAGADPAALLASACQ